LYIAISRTGLKWKPRTISEKLNIINSVDVISNVPHNKITEKLGIPTREVTYITLGVSDSGENVLRLLQITQI
jgi:hypothetical protein